MKGSVIQALILSDLQQHQRLILLSIFAGGLALVLLQLGGAAGIIGSVWFFTALIVLGSILPSSNVINEKKKQTRPFLMSLPLSPVQYGIAKMVSTFAMFVVPWLTLVIAGIVFVVTRREIPDGIIPLILITAIFTFIGFCLIAGVALVSESEGWTIAVTVASNSSYGLVWYFLIANPAVRADLLSPTAVWNTAVLRIFGAQIAAVVVILGLTLYLQSRKRDFV